MTTKQFVKVSGVVAAAIAVVVAASLTSAAKVQAHDDERDGNEAKIRLGFEIAPVPLNLKGKNRELVGLGSYLVNAVGDCNGCHTASNAAEYADGGNPFFKGNQPKVVNQATYLAGGNNFGPLISGMPDIVSRNLTPDKTGRAIGGDTFAEFLHTIRTGEDPDHLHPNCSATVTTNCFPAAQPFNGDLLQIMPWPAFQSMTEHDLRAIYEYLSAIPCIAGPAAPSELHHDCT